MSKRKGRWSIVVLAAAMFAGTAAGGDALLSENFKLDAVTPRIFSPLAGTAAVNRVRFSFSNPDNCEVTIRIFDTSGALVKRTLDCESDTVMFWNGSDTSGARVKGGIYIYQIEAGKKVVSGTIIVAQ